MTVAALFVATGGVYFGLPDVVPYDEQRDARLYPGPYPVVAHPPCERWGRYWSGGPNPRARRWAKGDDGGEFAAALKFLRLYGGVLEHPEASHAWRHFDLLGPPREGGWYSAGPNSDGWTCCVEQGHYGHPARKATWLLVVGVPRGHLPELRWGPSGQRQRLDAGYHSAEAARADRARPDRVIRPRTSARDNLSTPPEFRDLLLSIADKAQRPTPSSTEPPR